METSSADKVQKTEIAQKVGGEIGMYPYIYIYVYIYICVCVCVYVCVCNMYAHNWGFKTKMRCGGGI